MARQLKEMGVKRYEHQGGAAAAVAAAQELGIETLVFVLCVTLSLLAAIIFFCAGGVPKNSKKASQDNSYRHGGSACTAGCGAACGGGCGG